MLDEPFVLVLGMLVVMAVMALGDPSCTSGAARLKEVGRHAVRRGFA
jgi:hypothetical protein